MKAYISLSSENSMVLTQILGHLNPDKVLILMSNYAKKKWQTKVEKILEFYKENQQINAQNIFYEVFDENTKNLIENLEKHIHNFINNLSENDELFYSTSLGNAIQQTLLQEILKKIAQEKKIKLKLFLAEPTTTYTITTEKKITVLEEPLKSPNFVLQNIKNRFAIFNSEVLDGYSTIWNKKQTTFKNYQIFEELRTEFFNNPFLRQDFTSYIEQGKINLKKQQQNVDKNLQAVFIDIIHKNFEKLEPTFLTSTKKMVSIYEPKIYSLFKPYNFDIETLVEIGDNGIENIFKEYNAKYRNKLFDKITSHILGNNDLLNRKLSLCLKQIKKEFKNEVAKSAIFYGLGDKITFGINKYIKTMHLDNFIERMEKEYGKNNIEKALKHCNSIALLFEDLLAYEAFRFQNKHKSQKIHSIYQNVKIKNSKKQTKGASDLELDLLIVKNSGNLLNIEAKSHHKSAKRKDLISRIENIKNLGGSKAKTYLVFPLLKKDLEQIKQSNNDQSFDFCLKTESWKNFLLGYEEDNFKDLEIIGFDEIAKKLQQI